MIALDTSSAASTISSTVLRPILGSPLRPRPAARLLARARSFSLDRKLIGGADPACSTALAARAAQLTSERSRAALAEALEGLPRAVDAPRRRTRLRPEPAAVLANEPRICDLARRLRSAEPLYARGVARVQALLNANSPLFRGDAPTLAAELETAEAQLGGHAGRIATSARHGSTHAGSPARPGSPGRSRVVGESIILPNGSWLHTRHDGA